MKKDKFSLLKNNDVCINELIKLKQIVYIIKKM